MNKPFDLEAAKRGEPFEYQDSDGTWYPARFIGERIEPNKIAIECNQGLGTKTSYWVLKNAFTDHSAQVSRLRMVVKTHTVYLNVYELEGKTFLFSYFSEEDARIASGGSGKYKTIAYKVEVPEDVK